jgi:hypothetical protein
MAPIVDLRSARLSDHAGSAMRRRLITEAQVRAVLRAPQKVVDTREKGS